MSVRAPEGDAVRGRCRQPDAAADRGDGQAAADGGWALDLDHVLDRLETTGVPEVVVVCWQAGKVRAALRARARPGGAACDRPRRGDVAGKWRRAAAVAGWGAGAGAVLSAEWRFPLAERAGGGVARLAAAFDPAQMDALLLARTSLAVGAVGRGILPPIPTGGLCRAEPGG
jgi:hypothetical protein